MGSSEAVKEYVVVGHDKTLACVLHHVGTSFADHDGCRCTHACSSGLQAEQQGKRERERDGDLMAVQLLLGAMRKLYLLWPL
jgi:hypothetical protein